MSSTVPAGCATREEHLQTELDNELVLAAGHRRLVNRSEARIRQLEASIAASKMAKLPEPLHVDGDEPDGAATQHQAAPARLPVTPREGLSKGVLDIAMCSALQFRRVQQIDLLHRSERQNKAILIDMIIHTDGQPDQMFTAWFNQVSLDAFGHGARDLLTRVDREALALVIKQLDAEAEGAHGQQQGDRALRQYAPPPRTNEEPHVAGVGPDGQPTFAWQCMDRWFRDETSFGRSCECRAVLSTNQQVWTSEQPVVFHEESSVIEPGPVHRCASVQLQRADVHMVKVKNWAHKIYDNILFTLFSHGWDQHRLDEHLRSDEQLRPTLADYVSTMFGGDADTARVLSYWLLHKYPNDLPQKLAPRRYVTFKKFVTPQE